MNYLNNKEYAKELYHHGILGMKWGKKNGPPYPLYAKESKIARSNMYDDPWTQIFGYKGLVFEDLTYVRLDGCEVDYDKLEDFIKIQ